MKKFIKLTALVLAVLMLALSFAACTDNGAEVTDGKKVLKMGTNAAFPPYEFKEGEDFVGIDVEIAQAIAAELGCELEIVDMDGARIDKVSVSKLSNTKGKED